MAFTSVAALVTGGEAVTATVVLSAVAEVGTAMAVVGAVTGSKDLLKIGATLGLVGGIGSLISGGISAATGSASEAAMNDAAKVGAANSLSDASYVGTSIADAGAGTGDGVISSAMSAPVSTGSALPDLSTQAMPGAPTTSAIPGSVQPSVETATPVSGTSPSPTDVAGPQGPTATTGAYENNPYSVGGSLGPDNMDVGGGWNPSVSTAPQSSSSFFSKFSDFANANKTLFTSGAQLLGGALNGMNQSAMWNQKMALDQQALQRVSYGNQTGNFAPNPAVPGSPVGIINGARV